MAKKTPNPNPDYRPPLPHRHGCDACIADAKGRLILLDDITALAIAAGARAIKTSRSCEAATYVYDIFGEDGGPYEIPYQTAYERLMDIWNKYPLEREKAEKNLKGGERNG